MNKPTKKVVRDMDKMISAFHRMPELNPENECVNYQFLSDMGFGTIEEVKYTTGVLQSDGLIKISSRGAIGRWDFTLTDKGKSYFLRQHQTRRKERAENIRYAITTTIAVLALALSIYSLYLQYK